MKKALQKPHFAGAISLSETAVGSGPGETRAGSAGDELAELLVLDAGGPLRGGPGLLQGSRSNGRSGRLRCLRGRLGQRAGDELQALRDELAEPAGDLGGTLAELERPDRVCRVDDERPVAREARRPRVPCDP